MPVYLMRHAEAVPEAMSLADESRYLSDSGRAAALAMGEASGRLGIAIAAVVSSPLVRAVQTAELVALGLASVSPSQGTPGSRSVRIHESLAPGRGTRRIFADLAELEGALLVGHEPSLSALAGQLTSEPRFAAFEKAQLVALEGGGATWTLLPGDREPRRYGRLNR
ncbi:MAG: histidine phosphatase family protein [Deltaproteobacteria bacterium]|nr:histidine phosphatase family protein [Deltaproteobacteria bacterium]